MTNPLDFTANDLHLFILCFFRVTGLVMFAPLLGSQVSPPQVKVGLSLAFAMILFPLVDRQIGVVPNMGFYVLAVAAEFGLGAIFGFAATLLFVAVQFGGQFIDQELGLSLANVIDPISNEQISIIGQFKIMLAMILWLLLDGHHFLFSALAGSFRSIPIMGMSFTDAAALHVTDTLVRDVFEVAIKVAAPAIVTLFLITLAMAFMARAVPEMNIFILGFSVRIVVGFFVLLVGVELFARVFDSMSLHHDRSLNQLLRFLGG